jgi:hypothetical protein
VGWDFLFQQKFNTPVAIPRNSNKVNKQVVKRTVNIRFDKFIWQENKEISHIVKDTERRKRNV